MKLEIINYNKVIKERPILKDINLQLTSGQIYGFYGRNGSGKTMLFRAISTLIFPDSGDITIDGVSIIKNDFDLRKIGILIEDPGFYSNLTGLENLNLLYTINNKKNDDYILSWMKEFELLSVKDKKYKEYSLGMKQKLRIIQAVMENQKIIILDEPTNGLDEKSVYVVRNVIKQLKNENKLILIASHNKEDLKILCDKIFNIDDGCIIGEIELWKYLSVF